MFAVQQTTTGKYFRRGNRWGEGDTFVDNLDDAELYRSRSAALNSAGVCVRIGTTPEGFARYSRHRTLPPNLEVVEVTVIQADTEPENRVSGLYLLQGHRTVGHAVQKYCLAEYVPNQDLCWLFDDGSGFVESLTDTEVTRWYTVIKRVLTLPLT
jgi:hypothetical protein